MCHRSLLRSSALLLPLLLAACDASSPRASDDPVAPGDAGPSPDAEPTADAGGIPIAESKLARTPASAVPIASLDGAVAANNAFALDLYSQARAKLQGAASSNVLTSPLSASLALTMTYAGANGQTATQMATALHYGSAAATIFEGQNSLSQALASRAPAALAADQQTASESGQPAPAPTDYQMQIVNSVWGEQTYAWEKPFLDVLASDYGTGVYLQDFVGEFAQARITINNWVSTETADKINDLLPLGSLDSSTAMVLVNAVHLKMPWASPFTASQTAPATFTRVDGSTVSPPFMNQTATYPYVDDGKAQIVGLPLSGGQLALVVALPHGDLATYEAGLAAGTDAVAEPTGTALVQLALPKFSFTSATFSLATALQAMGMPLAFNQGGPADFSGLAPVAPGKLHISDVLQKAMVAVQENGVEAAAATAVILDGASGSTGSGPVPVPVVVNRPFVLSIVDVPTGAVLFVGHIVDPTNLGSP